MENVGFYIVEGIIMAIIAAFFSRSLVALLSAAVIVPLIFWVIVATTQMTNNPEAAQEIADTVSSQVFIYVRDRLPGIAISSAFGTITGIVIGYIFQKVS